MNTPDSGGNPTVEPDKGTQSDKDTLPDLPTTSEITRLATAILTGTPGLHWESAVDRALEYWESAQWAVERYAVKVRWASWEDREFFLSTGELPLWKPIRRSDDGSGSGGHPSQGEPNATTHVPSATSRLLWRFAEKIAPEFPSAPLRTGKDATMKDFLSRVFPGDSLTTTTKRKHAVDWLITKFGSRQLAEGEFRSREGSGFAHRQWIQDAAHFILYLRRETKVKSFHGSDKPDPMKELDRLIPPWQAGGSKGTTVSAPQMRMDD